MKSNLLLPHLIFLAVVALIIIASTLGALSDDKRVALANYLHDYSLPYASCDEGLQDTARAFEQQDFRHYSTPDNSVRFFEEDVLRDASDYSSKIGIYRSTDKLKVYRRAYDAGQACGGRSAEDILLLMFSL